MKIETTEVNSVIIFRLTGDNRLYALNAPKLKDRLYEILSQPQARLIIDFEEIYFIDSSGFSVLISALKTSKENNSNLMLCNVSSDVMELFDLMQLHTIFNIQDTVTECLNNFAYLG